MEEMQISELNKKKLDLIDWINQLSDNEQKKIQKGMDDIKKGNVISSAQFWKELKNVLEKKRIVEYSNIFLFQLPNPDIIS